MPTAVNNAYTTLAISGIGVQPYSARGIQQSLEPIGQAAQARRTVNGVLKDISFPAFRKFASTISCEDQTAPACDGVWPGRTVTVDCAAELSYKTAGGSPSRTVVAGSSRVDGDYTFYRPQLVMMVMGYSSSSEEYAASVSWSMDLEEV